MRKVVAEIHVLVYDDETVQVTGPIHDKNWCMKALEVAKETIKHHRGVDKPIIIPHQYVPKELTKV